MSGRSAKVALAALIPVGGWVLHGFASSNGLIQMFEDLAEKEVLSDGVTRFSHVFTGADGLDRLLRTLLNFFWPVVNGHDAALSLYSFMFAGQGVALMVINMLEGMRHGNKSLVISFVAIYGLAYMVVGLAVMAPLYLFFHILTSSTALTPTKASIGVDESAVRAVSMGTLLGYIVPTILMILPHPSILSTEVKASVVILWQAMPLWAAIFASLWKGIECLFSARSEPNSQSSHKAMRALYTSAIAIGATTHIATIVISLEAIISASVIDASVRSSLAPLNLLVPPNPFTTETKISSFLEGATWFLQMDYTMTSLAYMVWALALRFSSNLKSDTLSVVGSAKASLTILVRLVVLGPLATALSLVWERDEIVWDFAASPSTDIHKTKRTRRASSRLLSIE